MRLTVLAAIGRPARARNPAMRRRPIMGKSVLSLMTMALMKSGNMLSGTVDFSSAPGSSSSIRPLQLATVSSVTRKWRPALALDQPRAAISSRMAMRSAGG
jgi:hypothetical protein